MFVYETNPDEIRNIKKLLPNKICSGYDEVPDPILKVCAPHIAKPLSTINNQSLKTGIFPDALKIAKVSPLLKKGSPDLVSNYRPLSILSIFSKILVKLFYDRLINFIKNHAPISIQQHGFSKSLSTQTAIFELGKTVCINFHLIPTSNQKTIQVKLNNDKIENVNATKFLGLWVQQNLKWDTYKQLIKETLIIVLWTKNTKIYYK
ncbi:uncharacterized protein LOC124788975 [Schistocerca piceifrons]|uniref:uncharacterized protein LOC124788975 n=1 Tax=Schistocerca piceifrons TaxID=274613 RepID=UPI001F5FB736|nr:uncharacterized protein LOC124788975 [Schistocerca piceifrons]